VIKSRLRRVTITDNAFGVVFASCVGCTGPAGLRIRDSVITGNAGTGVIAGPRNLLIKRSEVSNNGLDPDLPECQVAWLAPTVALPVGCVDIESAAAPRIDAGSTCGTSFDPGTGNDWDVCAND
jgi:hypothetical protein